MGEAIHQAFRQTCSWAVPTTPFESQYVHLLMNLEGRPVTAQVFGALQLAQERKDQAAQIACSVGFQFKLHRNALYHIRLEGEKASTVIFGLKPLIGQVTNMCIGYVEIQTENSIFAVPTAGKHQAKETVIICFQPLPILVYVSSEDPSYTPDGFIADTPTDLLESQVEVEEIDINRNYRFPIGFLAHCMRYNQQQRENALSLASHYTHWSPVRGDGNSYNRCAAIIYLEHLCRISTPLSLFVEFYIRIVELREAEIPYELADFYIQFLSLFKRLYS